MELIIAGFHRSGTSLLTQLLHSAGLFVGEKLLGAMPSNPYGHFEDVEALELHRSILEAHGTDWQWDATHAFYIAPHHWQRMKSFAYWRRVQQANWGFKDPRVCFFMGAWKYVIPTAKAVIVYRDPGECVRSMESRQARAYFERKGNLEAHLRFFREPDLGLKMWDVQNRHLIAYAEKHLDDCIVIPFTHITDGYPVISMINNRFGSDLDPIPTTSVFDEKVTGARQVPQRVIDPEVGRRVEETWAALESLALRSGGLDLAADHPLAKQTGA